MKNPSLVALYCYPLKSARGLSLKTMKITATGPQWDRHWMVINADGSFVSQRSDPAMALVTTQLTDQSLVLGAPGQPDIAVPLEESFDTPLQEVTVFGAAAQGRPVGGPADQWFSNYLGKPCHLVRSPESARRQTSAKYDPSTTPISFADGFPFLSLSLQSLEALNRQLDVKVGIDRFRPNLVIDGSHPHLEDEIKSFTLGPVTFYSRKDCTRCSIVTVDPQTGHKHNEVMQALLRTRKTPKGVVFGQNLSHQGSGTITVGNVLQNVSIR